jgi:BlaI family transcriptional regulator, penicillinase repressor
MDAIWHLGEATADQVRVALPEPLHDSTVRTLLRVLEAKGYLRHEVQGKAYVYRAAIEQRKAQRHALRSILAQLFGGSAKDLVLRLIEDERITPDQLEELRHAAPQAQTQQQARRSKRSGRSRKSHKGQDNGE